MVDINKEIEYKFELTKNKLHFILDILNEKAKTKFRNEYQKSIMFDNQDNLMKKTNGRIRLRINEGKSQTKFLTYKKPLGILDGAKIEEEYEVIILDGQQHFEKIIEKMGYHPSSSYERYQSKWELNSIIITIDNYPFGHFIEIEGKLKIIKPVIKLLGLDIDQSLTKPIDSLFLEWRRKRKLKYTPHMKFDDYNK